MALVVTIAGVNRTAIVEEDSIRITQLADSFTFKAFLEVFDEDSNITIVAGSHKAADEITMVDGETVYFGGFVVNQDFEYPRIGSSRHLKLQCQGYGILLNEALVEFEEYTATADDAIIDDLFDSYLAVIDSVTEVAQIDAGMNISFTEMTLAECMDAICQRTQGRWYVDNEDPPALHYFADEGNDAGFDLSDEPNNVTSFSHHDRPKKRVDASAIVNRVRVIGADGFAVTRNDAGGGSSQDTYGIRGYIATNHSLLTTAELEEYGDAILDKNKDPRITYIVRTFKGGAVAGNEIDFKCDELGYNSISNGDDPLVIREMHIYWEKGDPVYEMTLGSHADISAITRAAYTGSTIRKIIIDTPLPLGSRGWGHDLVFSSTDEDTVAWAGGTITTAGGVGSFSIDAGNTGNMAAVTYVYLDVAVSSTVLQTTVAVDDSVGSGKILVAVCENHAGEEASFLVGSDLLIVGDHLAVNSIKAAHIKVDAVEADKILAGAVTAVKLAIGESFFTTIDGLLLLNPPLKILQEGSGAGTANYLYGKRGEKARIGVNAAAAGDRGALHLEQGRWQGTQAIVIEGAGLNYITNPLMYDGNTDGTADGWTPADTLGSGGDPTLTVVAHPNTPKGWLQRVVYSGVAGDVDDWIMVYIRTAAASFAEGDDVTVSIVHKGSLIGVVGYIRIVAETAVNGFLGAVNTVITPTSSLQRSSGTYSSLPATTDHLFVALYITGVDNSDEIDVYFGEVNVEKADFPTTLIHGNAGEGYDWTNGEHASTSTRTKSYVLLDDYVDLIADNNTVSFRCVVRAPYDYDGEWPLAASNMVWDFRGANDNNRVFLRWRHDTDVFEVFINGATRLSEAGAFSEGDWLDIVITLDFSADDYNLYINGVLADNDTTAIVAPTAVAGWNVGSGYDETIQGGFWFAEYAVFDRVLTAEEVAQMYNLQRPNIDSGSQDKPGIYILDGQFRIASSQTGNRIQIDAEEIAGYNASGTKQFYLRALDGKAVAGAGAIALDDGGVKIAITTAAQDVRAYKFIDSGGNVFSGIWAYAVDAFSHVINIQANAIASRSPTIGIYSNAPATTPAYISIKAMSGADFAQILLTADSDAAVKKQIDFYAAKFNFGIAAVAKALVSIDGYIPLYFNGVLRKVAYGTFAP